MKQGALVVSLDFELAWGVIDGLGIHKGYEKNLFGARDAIPRILDLFNEFGIAATWATVGFLFAESAEELLEHAPPPGLRPNYENPRLDPYRITVGDSERDDPLHLAPSLIRQIASTPRQEIGSHTYSHYLTMEQGSVAEAFHADLQSATSIASSKGIQLRSLVIPRHQTRRDFLPIYAKNGFDVHRGNEPNWLNEPRPGRSGSLPVRALRLLDSYLNLTGVPAFEWERVLPRSGLHDVPESRFLRPWSPRMARVEPLRRQRVIQGLEHAARTGRIYHLWWHPHNFGADIPENLRALRRILERYQELSQSHGLASFNMAEAADAARTLTFP